MIIKKIIKHKIYKYAMRYCDSVKIGERSVYFMFGTQILRISDHIGKNSSGDIAILIDKKGNYILHQYKTNGVAVVSYDEIKTIIKGLSINCTLCAAHTQQEITESQKTIQGQEIARLNKLVHQLKEEIKILKN